ncbi:MAG: hypothetical protein ACT4PX_05700 [Actinomycetota bacterium]
MTVAAGAPAPPAGATPGPLERLRTADPLLLVLRASLVVLLVNGNDDPVVMAGVAVLCFAALPRPRLLCSPWLWAGAFAAVGARQLATWHTLDDHVVVTTYWCGAIALGLGARDPRATMALSARWLVGLVFALAAGWKLLSGQFLDGTFFRYALLFDERFEVLSRTLAGTTDRIRDADVGAVAGLLAGGGGGEVALVEGSGGPALALVFTWWGVLVEAAVALTFLLPLRGRWRHLRPASLFAFAGTTYVLLPVGAFGALLLVLGAAQAESERLRAAYVLGIGAMLAWAAAWPVLFLR